MILCDYVYMGMSPATKKHFEGLGYKWLGQGVKTKIKVEHLLPTCREEIRLCCDECYKEYKQTYIYRMRTFNKFGKDLCSSCVRKGSRNPSFGKDRTDILLYVRKFQKINGMKGKKHKDSSKQKMSRKRIEYIKQHTEYPNVRKYVYKSIRYNKFFNADSKLEIFYMYNLDIDDNVEYWRRNIDIIIEYTYRGKLHRYIPDFIVKYYDKEELYVIETKGYYTEKDKIKSEYAKEYCKRNNFIYKLVFDKDVNIEYRKFLKNWRKFKDEFGVL